MITKETISKIINDIFENEKELLGGKSFFLVEVITSHSNQIAVHIDSFEGINIDECAKISKAIEAKLDRDKEDFQLTVSSAGLDRSFVVKEQYEKNIDKELRISTEDGKKRKVTLIEVNNDDILVEHKTKKNKKIISNKYNIPFEEIKSAKVVISFK